MAEKSKNVEMGYQLNEKNLNYYNRLKKLVEDYKDLTKEMWPAPPDQYYQKLTEKICLTYGELNDLLREITHSLVRGTDNSLDVNSAMEIFFEGQDLHGQRYIDLDKEEKHFKESQKEIKDLKANGKNTAVAQLTAAQS